MMIIYDDHHGSVKRPVPGERPNKGEQREKGLGLQHIASLGISIKNDTLDIVVTYFDICAVYKDLPNFTRNQLADAALCSCGGGSNTKRRTSLGPQTQVAFTHRHRR
eukprot:scaffold6431_cov139-Skeletonema_menzelii.AAC.12